MSQLSSQSKDGNNFSSKTASISCSQGLPQTVYVAENGLELLILLRNAGITSMDHHTQFIWKSLYCAITGVPSLQLLECVIDCYYHSLFLFTTFHIFQSTSLLHLHSCNPEQSTVIHSSDWIWAGWSGLPWTRAGKPDPHPPLVRAMGSRIGKHFGRKGSLLMPDVLLQSQTWVHGDPVITPRGGMLTDQSCSISSTLGESMWDFVQQG